MVFCGMATLHFKPSGPWENKFRTPSADDLLASFTRSVAQLIEHARHRLREAPGVHEEVSWQGVPWRWAFVFRHESDRSRPWACVVPEPTKPRIALPFTVEVIARLPARRLSKPVRDALIHGVEVDGVRWAEWELSSRPLVDEVLALAAARSEAPTPG
jgi:hypothetical protein